MPPSPAGSAFSNGSRIPTPPNTHDSPSPAPSSGSASKRQSPRLNKPYLYNSDRSVSKSTSRATKVIPPKDTNGLPNLCFFCRQGGLVRVCDGCKSFAACITHGDIYGCLPEWVKTNPEFRCPECYARDGTNIPLYPVPSNGLASSRRGMNTGPLILYCVYLAENSHSGAGATLLEAQLAGYFKSKEDNLLVVSHGFTDLFLLSERRTITNNSNTIQNFLRNKSSQDCQFILYIQTHANPADGGLFYSPSKSVGILVFLTCILGTIQPELSRNPVLLINACGHLFNKDQSEVEASGVNFGFKSIYCLSGNKVDPLLVAVNLFYNVLDFHVIGNETSQSALERSANPSILSNTSLILWVDRTIYSLCGAALRYRPNGEWIQCSACHGSPGFRKILKMKNGADGVQFRCRACKVWWTVELLPSDEKIKFVGGLNALCRFMVTRLK